MIKTLVKLDWLLMMSMFLLTGFGLLAIYSLSHGGAINNFNFYEKQTFFLILGSVLFFLGAFVDYNIWRSYGGIIYIISIFFLILVLIIGRVTNGATSWLDLGFFKFQPVELVKVGLIIVLAKYFSRLKNESITWREIIISSSYVGVPLALVLLQPDFGSAIILLVIWLGMVFLMGMNIKKIIIIVFTLFFIIFFSWFFVLKNYQKERVLTFMDPSRDTLGSGYNVIQATIAVGSGGLKGKGIGRGSQSQLNFIPEQHTDFIFSSIAEESGFIGVSLILFSFGMIFFRLKQIAINANTRFATFVVDGIMIMFIFQVLVNIGMNIGLVPVTGLSLPFISYGGSFLVISMFLMGIVENIFLNAKKNNSFG